MELPWSAALISLMLHLQHGSEQWYPSSCLSWPLPTCISFITCVWWFKTPHKSPAFHVSSSAAGKGSARPPWQELLRSQEWPWAKGAAPSPGVSEAVLLWEGGAGVMPDKPWWKEQENEKNFPALHKKAQFCDVSLINVYMNTVFVYI